MDIFGTEEGNVILQLNTLSFIIIYQGGGEDIRGACGYYFSAGALSRLPTLVKETLPKVRKITRKRRVTCRCRFGPIGATTY